MIQFLQGGRIEDQDAGETIDFTALCEGQEETTVRGEFKLIDLVIPFPQDSLRFLLIELLNDYNIGRGIGYVSIFLMPNQVISDSLTY